MSTLKLMGTGVFTAVAASLCCITPVLALIAGSGSIASSFSWIEPARPYLIGLTVAVLGLAWYQKLRPLPKDDCGCVKDEKTRFFQTTPFLFIVTFFAVLMISFPAYAKIFFPKNEEKPAITNQASIQIVELSIKGMSCASCEGEVNHEVYKLPGIILSIVSYENKNAIIKYDTSKTTVKNITNAVNATGYKVIKQTINN